MFLDLEAGAFDLSLQHWTCLLEAGPSAPLHSQKEIMLVGPALNLSFGSCALDPASFLIRNYVCFWSWILRHCTCHSSIELVILKLGLRPSFILNKKLYLFLDLEAGTLDLSLQHWTCLFEAGTILNKKLGLFLDLEAGTLDLSLQRWTYLLEAGPKKLCLFLDLEAGALDLSLQH